MEQSDLNNKIAELCLEHFSSLPKTGKPSNNEWTILSCIVMNTGNTGNTGCSLEVVALGTGSKCIGRSKMSNKGVVLNDSHAEVICRRSFLLFIYSEMLKCEHGKSDVVEFDDVSKKFKLKTVKFHFFTTQVPCGDAAIFLKDSSSDNIGSILVNNKDGCTELESDKYNSNISHNKYDEDREIIPVKKVCLEGDIHRTGAKCLREDAVQDPKLGGTQYHVTGVVRTKPGRGDPTLSVSCSDKIARWCHLGIQGALLTLLLTEPIYLASFTIAGETPFNHETLKRAFYDRVCDHRVSHVHIPDMEIGQATCGFTYAKKEDKQPSPASIIWCRSNSDRRVEVAVEGRRQGVTKKKMDTEAGRVKICRLELFRKFIEITHKFKINIGAQSDIASMTYGDVKALAGEYQSSWHELKSYFKIWTKKDTSYCSFVNSFIYQ